MPFRVVDLKEHVAVTIFASTAADSALAISIFAADDLFYRIQVFSLSRYLPSSRWLNRSFS